MKKNRRIWSFGALLTSGACALAATTLASSKAEAFPVLLCGPSFQWICTDDSGVKIPFVGTICDARQFERRNHVVCVRN
ncbi:MAG: hypothetical protein H6812_04055 [Phycisphaeraceae bacterium]|nr:hypothetical protein [Phycisphaerales bacterium]MCB9842410.1 hypothetical protein [Phycisphaeraceae bacterium]